MQQTDEIQTAMDDSPLPIDSCPLTKQQEAEFFDSLCMSTNDRQSSIIFSRIHQCCFKLNEPLQISSLKEKFKSTGHTLSIDCYKSYYRAFHLDLDCLCRKKSWDKGHLSLPVVDRVCEAVKQCIRSFIKKDDFIISIWNHKCGYHLYTNLMVSLPTHLLLCKLINVELASEAVIIEVPHFMPLPYSAKRPGAVYVPLDDHLVDVPLTFHSRLACLEMFTFDDDGHHESIATFVKDDGLTTTSLRLLESPTYEPIQIGQGLQRLTVIKSIYFMQESLIAHFK